MSQGSRSPAIARGFSLPGCDRCQRAIASQIHEQGGYYVLSVKENQPTLYADIEGFFLDSDRTKRPVEEPAPEVMEHTTVDADHGRLEKRTCRMSKDLSWVQGKADWKGLTGIARVESVREDLITGTSTTEYRFYIVSVPDPTAEKVNSTIRNHWGIENGLHWVLDVTFGEDATRVRMGNAAENLSTLRKTALNLLKRQPETKKKLSIPRKRKRCAWNQDYLISVISNFAAD